jgi:hypothetical protein
VRLTLRKQLRRRMPRAAERYKGTGHDFPGVWSFGCQLRSCVRVLRCDYHSATSCHRDWIVRLCEAVLACTLVKLTAEGPVAGPSTLFKVQGSTTSFPRLATESYFLPVAIHPSWRQRRL